MKYRIPAGVAWTEDEASVYVARVPEGPIVVLSESARVIWAMALTSDAGELVDRVAAASGQDAVAIAADVEAFVAELTARGLLESAVESDGEG